jgi:hypothetical protein
MELKRSSNPKSAPASIFAPRGNAPLSNILTAIFWLAHNQKPQCRDTPQWGKDIDKDLNQNALQVTGVLKRFALHRG